MWVLALLLTMWIGSGIIGHGLNKGYTISAWGRKAYLDDFGYCSTWLLGIVLGPLFLCGILLFLSTFAYKQDSIGKFRL